MTLTTREKQVLITAATLLLVLALVAAWQVARAGSSESRLQETRTELALQRHESTLALAAIEANRGSFELARQLASDFFTGVQADLASAPVSARDALQQILVQRDGMITALSRSDPQAAPQLVQLLMRYRIALGRPIGPQQPSGAAPAQPPAPKDSTPG